MEKNDSKGEDGTVEDRERVKKRKGGQKGEMEHARIQGGIVWKKEVEKKIVIEERGQERMRRKTVKGRTL
jgi:hypothetical protein